MAIIGGIVVGIVAAIVVAPPVIWCWNRAFRGTKWEVHMRRLNCPRCGTPLPRLRRPRSRQQALWGGSTCASCGCEVDKHGKEIAAQP
jgi:hypothetical protein